VTAAVADLITPVGVLPVELAQAAETAGGPEAGLKVAHRPFDRALLPRCCRRASVRVEGVVAAQVQEAVIPDDLVALAAGDDRTQVVVDALARHTLQPLERTGMSLQEGLDRHLEREERGLRTRVRERGNKRVHPPLPASDLRPRRHLGPVQLHHLPRPVAGPLRRPHLAWTKLAQPTPHDVDRADIAVLAQHLGRPRRLDLRPLLNQPPQHGLEAIEARASRRTPVARRLLASEHPGDGAPVDPQPARDLPLREPVRRQRPRPRPLQRAQHLLTSSPRPDRPVEPASRAGQISAKASGALFAARSRCSIGRRASPRDVFRFAWNGRMRRTAPSLRTPQAGIEPLRQPYDLRQPVHRHSPSARGAGSSADRA
jgi:hypothetical protein